jgi:hypothetical protein
MFTELLSSKPKTALINLFLTYPQRAFTYTELRLSSNASPLVLKPTLKDLVKMQFLNVLEKTGVKYYQVNKGFNLYPELVGLLRKTKTAPADMLARAVGTLGECKLAAITGVFVGKPRVETDLLLVGKVSPAKLKKVLALAEKLAEQEVSYTIFTQQEFDYRKIMNDRFVKNVMENNPVLVIDKVKNRILTKLVYKS